jgi:hypothetical protein
MKSNTSRIAVIAIGSALMLPLNTASAETPLFSLDIPLKILTAQWWQWALSIPTSVNPQQDATGANCMVGQRGFVWFLAGVFPGGNATRTCSVPADKALFSPVANQINFNTPNVCGQGPANLTVADMRASSAAFVAGVTSKSVKVDGRPVMNIQRIQSIVFEVALPEDNVFDALCAPLNVPAGIFSPAVDDGFYVLLRPLQAGSHMIQITAQNKSQGFVLDVKYNLNVVPVSLQ